MKGSKKGSEVIFQFVLTVVAVAVFSVISVHIWGGKAEVAPVKQNLAITGEMTVGSFKDANNLPSEVIRKVFNVSSKEDLKRSLNDIGMTLSQIEERVQKASAIATEDESKNWIKILAKFMTWAIFLIFVYRLLAKKEITARTRLLLLFFAVVIFGVLLGSDPSPMGTVKDAVVLLGSHGVIFPPRLLAFIVMLVLGVMIANKFLCSWGCQLGTLQDFIFRLNRDSTDKRGIMKQYKIPFKISNGVRISVFLILSFVAFAWGTDIIEPIDPFKIFNPVVLGVGGLSFVFLILLASLFVYRPWCHLFCPFGLVGWLVERFSYFKIHVDRDTCISCRACVKACPSNVMGAILDEEKIVPDCFSCGTCIKACPTNSISFTHVSKKDKK